jgi:plastocyanin
MLHHLERDPLGKETIRMTADRLIPRLALAALLMVAFGAGSFARAADPTTIRLTLKDHQFSPSEIHIPAGTPVTLVVRNEDSSPEEIDSSELKIEKIVAAGQEISLTLRPLDKGSYPFVGEFHEDTAKGTLVVE